MIAPDFLIQPFQYEFFTRSIIVSILIGGTCGLLGVYIILRGMSYIGHGMSHAVFGGAVLSNTIGFNFYIGAAIWGVISGVLITEINKRYKIKATVITETIKIKIKSISVTANILPNNKASKFLIGD